MGEEGKAGARAGQAACPRRALGRRVTWQSASTQCHSHTCRVCALSSRPRPSAKRCLRTSCAWLQARPEQGWRGSACLPLELCRSGAMLGLGMPGCPCCGALLRCVKCRSHAASPPGYSVSFGLSLLQLALCASGGHRDANSQLSLPSCRLLRCVGPFRKPEAANRVAAHSSARP